MLFIKVFDIENYDALLDNSSNLFFAIEKKIKAAVTT